MASDDTSGLLLCSVTRFGSHCKSKVSDELLTKGEKISHLMNASLGRIACDSDDSYTDRVDSDDRDGV